MTSEYRIALEHWAKQFRNGNLSDKFADEIAYLLEDKAHDLKMDEGDKPMEKRYRVEVRQINVFYIKAKNEDKARQIATEDFSWDENQDAPNHYGVDIIVDEVDRDGWTV